jgi:hypothetical protein
MAGGCNNIFAMSPRPVKNYFVCPGGTGIFGGPGLNSNDFN